MAGEECTAGGLSGGKGSPPGTERGKNGGVAGKEREEYEEEGRVERDKSALSLTPSLPSLSFPSARAGSCSPFFCWPLALPTCCPAASPQSLASQDSSKARTDARRHATHRPLQAPPLVIWLSIFPLVTPVDPTPAEGPA